MKTSQNILLKNNLKFFYLILFFLSIHLVAQKANKTKAYVWDFTDSSGNKLQITKDFTKYFEEALIKTKVYTVLERRNLDELFSQIYSERSIQELNDIPPGGIKILNTHKAEIVIFGEIYDNVDANQLIITVKIENFKGEILNKEIRSFDREIINDHEKQKESMNILVNALIQQNYIPFTLKIEPAEIEIQPAERIPLTATVIDESNNVISDPEISWQSSNNSIASITENGLVTGHREGTVTIHATCNGKSFNSLVKVKSKAETIIINPTNIDIFIGGTSQLTAIIKDERGRVLNNQNVVWSCENESVVSVSELGVVKGNNLGNTTIRANINDLFAKAQIKVIPHPLSEIRLWSSRNNIRLGERIQIIATLIDSQGNSNENYTVTWSSSNESVASVTQTGLVISHNVGVVTISAMSQNVTGGITINIQGGNIIIAASANPSIVPNYGQTQINVQASSENGTPISNGNVRIVSCTDGRFLSTGNPVVTGNTDANGMFMTRWQAPAYISTGCDIYVKVTKPGFIEGDYYIFRILFQ